MNLFQKQNIVVSITMEKLCHDEANLDVRYSSFEMH